MLKLRKNHELDSNREPALNLERDLGIPLPIYQAAMAQPPPARVRDRSADPDLGTTYLCYARADTRVDANSSEVLSDAPSIPLLVDLSAPATDYSILSSTRHPPAQQPPTFFVYF